MTEQMPPIEFKLVAQIESFLARRRMSPSSFGRAAVKDSSLVDDLRKGRELRGKTRNKIKAYLRGDA